MNAVIDTLLSHRSIRKFTDQAITPEQLDTIIRAGRARGATTLCRNGCRIPRVLH